MHPVTDSPTTPPPRDESFARLYRNAWFEARFTLTVCLLATAWTVFYCYLRGYIHYPDSWVVKAGLAKAGPPAALPTILGFPEWVFFGIILPWALCTIITILFAHYGMADDELGQEGEEGVSRESHP